MCVPTQNAKNVYKFCFLTERVGLDLGCFFWIGFLII